MCERIQPIATAPLDGTVVLTEEGFARFVAQSRWASPVTDGWQLCYSCGALFKDADDGLEPFSIVPKWWMPVPDFPVNKE